MSESGWQYAVINAPSSVTLVSGTAGKKIRVLSALIVSNNGYAEWKFQSSTGPTDLVGNLFLSSGLGSGLTATGALVLPHNPTGWFETAAGDDLLLDQNGGSAGAGGCLVYELV